MIKRFERADIVFHWVYAASFLVLALTGAPLVFESLRPISGVLPRMIHRVAGVIFILNPILFALFMPRQVWSWVREAFVYTRDDVAWLLRAPLAYSVRGVRLPPAGKYNSGQKLNMLVTFLTWIMFAASGTALMLFREAMSRDWFRTWGVVHNVAFTLGMAMALLHMYLTLLHPLTRATLPGMLSGYVSASYARYEHPRWYEEVGSRTGHD